MEQHLQEHDNVKHALVRVTLLANTSPALSIITATVREVGAFGWVLYWLVLFVSVRKLFGGFCVWWWFECV